jgi:hypothetical protein
MEVNCPAREAARVEQPELVPNPDPSALTLEHILPEHPDAGAWPQFTADAAKGYAKRLGNMLLLTQRVNSKIKSGPFSVKRGVYEKSELLLTKSVAASTNWNKEAIDKRQKHLADLAVRAWKINI